MSHGNRINGAPNAEPPRSSPEQGSPNRGHNSQRGDAPAPNLKHNAAQLFRHDWQSSQAHGRKNDLLTMLLGTNPAENSLQTLFSRTNAPAANSLNQSLENLINLAREHKDFKNFQNRAENFWENVSRMSEVRIFTSNSGETRVTSRYAELIDKLNLQGGRIETFLRSLPNNEREIFAARYQLEKTFGAGKLFIGNGLTLDKNGNFDLRGFLSGNNKSTALPLNFVVSMRESGAFGTNSALTGTQILFNAESHALLSISLAFYQNVSASMNLKDAVIYTLFQDFISGRKENPAASQPLNSFTGEVLTKKPTELVVVGALINGALPSVDKNSRFFDKIGLAAFSNGESANRLGFSAGAAGAMLGAAIGCLVPMAADAAGRATGLAASIVVGSAQRGLRSMSIDLLISDAVTNAVQTLLDTVPNHILPDSETSFLPAASLFEDLNSNFLNRRMNAFLAA